MRARIGVYGKTGVGFTGYLPTTDLEFSEEVGGSGTCTYEALMSDVNARAAWDAVLKIELETPGGWVPGPAYVSRHTYTHKAGFRRFKFTCRSLLEAWSDETVVLPEYSVGTMPRRAGEERGFGWMSSAYDPADDPSEPWDRCYQTDRTTKPDNWPTGTGAEWISASGATSETEAKYFRSWLTITGTERKLVRFYLSSDESAQLWIAGEKVIETDSVEDGKKTFEKHTLGMYPGTYAVGVYTATHFSKGGDGIDPILVAGCTLDSEGDPASWIVSSNNSTWKACRRDNEPPDDVPPGPTPGEVLRYMIGEAQERNATGWDNVTLDFTDTLDSYGDPWADISERNFRYGSDTYWSVFQALSESAEVDVWLGADLVLHAAKRQGQARALTFTNTHFHAFSTEGTEGHGTWVMAQAHNGWIHERVSGPRREYAIELGEAISRSVGRRIARAALQDAWRWDAAGSMNPPQTGWIPYVDFKLGDWMDVSYQAVVHQLSVTSLSAKAGEGGLLWDVEFTEYPPDGSRPTTEMYAS